MSWGYDVDNGEYHFLLHDCYVFNFYFFAKSSVIERKHEKLALF